MWQNNHKKEPEIEPQTSKNQIFFFVKLVVLKPESIHLKRKKAIEVYNQLEWRIILSLQQIKQQLDQNISKK